METQGDALETQGDALGWFVVPLQGTQYCGGAWDLGENWMWIETEELAEESRCVPFCTT